jgi:hypothetical protein
MTTRIATVLSSVGYVLRGVKRIVLARPDPTCNRISTRSSCTRSLRSSGSIFHFLSALHPFRPVLSHQPEQFLLQPPPVLLIPSSAALPPGNRWPTNRAL